MSGDGFVEVRIGGGIDPSLPAAAQEVRKQIDGVAATTVVSAEKMSDALNKVGGDLSKVTPAMLGLGSAEKTVTAETVALAAAEKDVAAETTNMAAATKTATTENTKATSAADAFLTKLKDQAATVGFNKAQMAAYRAEQLGVTAEAAPFIDALDKGSGHAISSRASFEGLVLVHEAIRGNFTRMVGSSMILGQALAGQEATTAALTAAMTPLGIAVIAGGAALIGAAVATYQYDESQRTLTNTSVGLGAVAGLTANQLRDAGAAAADYSGMSVRASTEAAESFAASGIRSQEVIEQLTSTVQTYAEMTGQKAADAEKALASAMQDPVKGAEDLNAQLGILDATQMEQIRTMAEAGDKTGAVNVIVQALKSRTDEANQAGIGLNTTWQNMISVVSNLFGEIGHLNSVMLDYEEIAARMAGIPLPWAAKVAPDEAKIKKMQHDAQLNTDSAAGAKYTSATPEGQDTQKLTSLKSAHDQLTKSLAAEVELHGANSEAAKKDAAALGDYDRAIKSWMPAAQKAHEISALDAKIADARHSKNATLIGDLTKQKELLKLSGEVMSAGDASARANDAGSVATERGQPHQKAAKKGPSVTSEWAEQLHAQEIQSGEYFKNQTETELAFWQSKIGLVKAGSKEWLEVQSHIYEASKSLAHQGYQDHLATINDQIEADHNNWKKEEQDWKGKLAFIASTFDEESSEYKNAHREFERLEREHQAEMTRLQNEGATKALDAFRKSVQSERQVREENAKADESVIKSKSGGSAFGDISAAVQIGQIHHQLMVQEQEDAVVLQGKEEDRLNKTVATAERTYTTDSDQYRNAVQDKLNAEAAFVEQKKLLDAKSRAQSISDILAVQQAYHSYVDSTVGAAVHGASAMIGGAQTWKQAVVGVYNSLVSTVEQQITRMVTNWITQHLLMTAAQRAQLAVQTAIHSGSEVTKTAATVGGASARAATEASTQLAAAAADKAATVAKVGSLVALAGAGGVASMAAAPFPLDLGAPAFGAAMAASAAGFGTLASFAVGTNFVPTDMVAQIHAGERIIPAADNQALMSAVAGGGGKGGGGDTHLHYAPQLSGDTKPFRQQLVDHSSDLISMIKSATRDGAFR